MGESRARRCAVAIPVFAYSGREGEAAPRAERRCALDWETEPTERARGVVWRRADRREAQVSRPIGRWLDVRVNAGKRRVYRAWNAGQQARVDNLGTQLPLPITI